MVVALTIFWSAVAALLFFTFEVIFKAIGSILKALITSIGEMMEIIMYSGLGVLTLLLLEHMATEGPNDKMLAIIDAIILLVIALCLIAGLFRALVNFVFLVFEKLGDLLVMLITFIAEFLADLCERMYSKNISRIMRCIEKC